MTGSMSTTPRTNFAFLQAHDAQTVLLGLLAERYFAEDPNTCLLKLRQLAEALAQLVASHVGLYTSSEEPQFELLRRLQDQGVLPREVAQLFNQVRRMGNAAGHAGRGDHRSALDSLRITWQLTLWFHRTFSDPAFKSGPFVPPAPPRDERAELRAELERLTAALDAVERYVTYCETLKWSDRAFLKGAMFSMLLQHIQQGDQRVLALIRGVMPRSTGFRTIS
jgi:type I restriction enzyme R subunit